MRLSFGRSSLSLVSALTATFTENAAVSADAVLAVHAGHRATCLDVATETLTSHAPQLREVPECSMAANAYAARLSVFISAA